MRELGCALEGKEGLMGPLEPQGSTLSREWNKGFSFVRPNLGPSMHMV